MNAPPDVQTPGIGRSLRSAPPALAVTAGLIALLAVFASCRHTASPELLPIDSVLQVRMDEASSGSARSLRLLTTTTREYSCLGFQVVFVRTHNVAQTSIDYRGVAAPAGPCATALGPATAEVPLGSLAEGTYTLRFKVNGETTTAKLHVTADSLRIEAPGSEWLAFPEAAIGRTP